jgi:hypothetical protein
MKKTKSLMYVLMSIITTYTMFSDASTLYYVENMGQVQSKVLSFVWIIVFVAFYFFYKKNYTYYRNDKGKIYSRVLGIVFSALMLIAHNFLLNKAGTIYSIDVFQYGLIFVGFYIFFTILSAQMFRLVDMLKEKSGCIEGKDLKIVAIYKQYTFIFAFSVIVICWLPYLVVSYPGNLPYDPANQLAGYLGYCEISTHHPVFSTWIIAKLFLLGKFIANDNLGVFFVTFTQWVTNALAFSYLVYYITKKLKKYFLGILTLLYVAIYYLWPWYATYIVKDMYSIPFYIIFTIQFLDIFFVNIQKTPRYRYVIMVGSGVMYCLFRYNGIYIIGITLFLTSLIFLKERKKLMTAMVCCVVLCSIYKLYDSKIVYYFMPDNMTVKEQLFKDGFSVPLQQTANYVCKYGNEVTDREKEVIDKVMNYNLIPELYNMELSDSVRWSRDTTTKQDMKEYMVVWFKMFFKHPVTYFEATFANTYRFFYFNQCYSGNYDVSVGILQGYLSQNPVLSIKFPEKFEDARVNLGKYCTLIRSIPIMYFFSICGTYTWAVIFMTTYLFKKREIKKMGAFLPVWGVIGICVLGPFNGNLVYLLPVVATIPVYMALVLFNKDENAIKQV